ncbi:MAG: 4-hydroxybenzoate octaprenyltransferase [Planctomycetota bacterium]
MEGDPHVTVRGHTHPLLLALRDIKLAHTVFALPFALLAAFLALPAAADAIRWPPFLGALSLVLACMVFARTWAMLINRIADHRIDADNPRTARRAIAAGELRVGHAIAIACACAGAFLACCAAFLAFDNPWPIILGAPVLAWIALYSFTKRFTWLAHLFLGGALAVSPIAAAIAVDPTTIGLPLADAPAALAPSGVTTLLLAGFVMLWVGGFDILYALQDLDFDRAAGLHSIPARFGRRGAAWISRALHGGAVALLFGAASADERLGLTFTVASILVAGLLITEHVVVAVRGLAGLPLAFFTINGVVSLILGAAGIADLILV